MNNSLPWFQFYTAEFLAQTVCMSPSSVGGFIRLLSYQWERGCIPAEEPRIRRITGWSAEEWATCWPEVVERLDRDEDGFREPGLAAKRSTQEEKVTRVTKSREASARARWERSSACERNANAMQMHGDIDIEIDKEEEGEAAEPPTPPVRRKGPKGRMSQEECLAEAAKAGLPERDGRAFFASMEACGWTRNGKPLRNAEAYFRAHVENGWLPSLRSGPARASPPPAAYRSGDTAKDRARRKRDAELRAQLPSGEQVEQMREQLVQLRLNLGLRALDPPTPTDDAEQPTADLRSMA